MILDIGIIRIRRVQAVSFGTLKEPKSCGLRLESVVSGPKRTERPCKIPGRSRTPDFLSICLTLGSSIARLTSGEPTAEVSQTSQYKHVSQDL